MINHLKIEAIKLIVKEHSNIEQLIETVDKLYCVGCIGMNDEENNPCRGCKCGSHHVTEEDVMAVRISQLCTDDTDDILF
jgi:hypothetical protein